MRSPTTVLLAGLLGCAAQPSGTARRTLDDAPEPRVVRAGLRLDPPTYDEALSAWHGIEDLNAWIADRFTYDLDRAVAFSETRRSARGDASKAQVYEPAEFYRAPKGVCVDLARFAYEATRKIEPDADPRYLMLEFEPITIGGEVLRRHWLVIFTRAGQFYSFADSKRPGYIAGPFPSLELLVADYERYRQRKIVSAKAVDDYKKKVRRRQMRKASSKRQLR